MPESAAERVQSGFPPNELAGTRMERATAALLAAHRGLSGIYSRPDGAEAFAAQWVLADAAERTIDAQYYIWHADLSGTLLFALLWRAAERGVRVRLLLDDNNSSGLDSTLAALDAHPNIEVRLFNPFKRRGARVLDYVFEFARLNRRMHNKSFTVERQATIVGGRNVGDEYFGAGQEVSFEDLDVLAVGPAVADVSKVFDAYWGCESAVPLMRLVPAVTPESGRRLMQSAKELEASERAKRYRAAVSTTPPMQDLMAGRIALDWAEARLVSDPPSKVLGDRRTVWPPVIDRLMQTLGTARHEVDIVSPYFVPTRNGVDALRTLATRGVRIRVLTNSLAATDVAAVHAGYAKYRRDLLEAGIALHELKPTYAGPTAGKRGARGGSSGASLHAKTFVVDRCRAYVGSLNFDPRSARLNTEMGVVIESPALATRISEVLDRDLPVAAYEVRTSGTGSLQWITRDDNGEQRYESEPGASLSRRIAVRLLSILPIEGLL